MTRRCLTVAAAAFLIVAGLTVWTHEASAFTTAVRLCVQKQRRNLRNSLLTARAQAQSDKHGVPHAQPPDAFRLVS